jgi:hypothetical protein
MLPANAVSPSAAPARKVAGIMEQLGGHIILPGDYASLDGHNYCTRNKITRTVDRVTPTIVLVTSDPPLIESLAINDRFDELSRRGELRERAAQ